LRIVNFLDNQTFCESRTGTKTYEEIRIVFYQRRHRHGVYRFFLPTAGDEGDHDYSSSGSTVTHSNAQQASQDDCWLGTQAC
jgi:hypothetical protein